MSQEHPPPRSHLGLRLQPRELRLSRRALSAPPACLCILRVSAQPPRVPSAWERLCGGSGTLGCWEVTLALGLGWRRPRFLQTPRRCTLSHFVPAHPVTSRRSMGHEGPRGGQPAPSPALPGRQLRIPVWPHARPGPGPASCWAMRDVGLGFLPSCVCSAHLDHKGPGAEGRPESSPKSPPGLPQASGAHGAQGGRLNMGPGCSVCAACLCGRVCPCLACGPSSVGSSRGIS